MYPESRILSPTFTLGCQVFIPLARDLSGCAAFVSPAIMETYERGMGVLVFLEGSVWLGKNTSWRHVLANLYFFLYIQVRIRLVFSFSFIRMKVKIISFISVQYLLKLETWYKVHHSLATRKWFGLHFYLYIKNRVSYIIIRSGVFRTLCTIFFYWCCEQNDIKIFFNKTWNLQPLITLYNKCMCMTKSRLYDSYFFCEIAIPYLIVNSYIFKPPI